MKYAILFEQTQDIVEYGVSVLRHIAVHYGHEIVSPDEADIIAVSVCDINQVHFAEKIRKSYTNKIIIIGGHAAVYFKLFGMFADFVNIGQGFEAFSCKTVEELERLDCIWSKAKDGSVINSSHKIDWSIVPLANVTQKQKYYWGAVGCKNKCHFCVTSWTNPHQVNSPARVAQVLKKYPNTTIVTNDSDSVEERMTQSVMLVDFLKRVPKKYGVYRIGVEFATEDTRKRYGKYFTDEQFYQVFKHALAYGTRLKLFCIGGINSKQEWIDLYNGIDPIYVHGSYEIKMTNLTYEMFTPIKRERHNIDPGKYWSTAEVRKFVTDLKTSGRFPFRAMPCTSPANAIRRNMLCYITNPDEYSIYLKARKTDKTDELMTYLSQSGFFKNDYSHLVKFNHKAFIDKK